MMIELQKGDILKSNAEALVNTVNCVGVMGRGIALQFRKAFPDNYKAYKAACDRKELCPGKMFIHDLGGMITPRYLINFPTKRHWKNKSRLEDIESGLKALVKVVREKGIRTIAVPPLGCGLGGLGWGEVRQKIEETLGGLTDVHVLLYEPRGTPAAELMVKQQQEPKMTVGRAALLGLMQRYLAAIMDPSITLLEIHKLMYFMQEAGEPLRLRYEKAPYGPYATNLRHVLTRIEGHFISGYGDAEDNPDKQIEQDPESTKQAEAFLREHPDTQQRFTRVVDLIAGFETPFGMELLSTVHWVATHEKASTSQEAIEKTYGWSERKQMFEKDHICKAWDILALKGWLNQKMESIGDN